MTAINTRRLAQLRAERNAHAAAEVAAQRMRAQRLDNARAFGRHLAANHLTFAELRGAVAALNPRIAPTSDMLQGRHDFGLRAYASHFVANMGTAALDYEEAKAFHAGLSEVFEIVNCG